MRAWTEEQKKRQAVLIHQWKPWLKAGVKTEAGKKISCMNAYKHGAYSAENRITRKMIMQFKNWAGKIKPFP